MLSKGRKERVPTAFHWTHGGNEVLLVGSFSKWQEYIPMKKEEGGKVFSHLAHLPIGIHSYKFIVDGKWKYCPDQEQVRDMEGNINNCIAITSNSLRESKKTKISRSAYLLHF